jgi:hypothetical protein
MNVDVLIDDLAAVMFELIAFYGDCKERRARVKEIVDLIPKRVAAFREIGRYPAGSGRACHPWPPGEHVPRGVWSPTARQDAANCERPGAEMLALQASPAITLRPSHAGGWGNGQG